MYLILLPSSPATRAPFGDKKRMEWVKENEIGSDRSVTHVVCSGSQESSFQWEDVYRELERVTDHPRRSHNILVSSVAERSGVKERVSDRRGLWGISDVGKERLISSILTSRSSLPTVGRPYRYEWEWREVQWQQPFIDCFLIFLDWAGGGCTWVNHWLNGCPRIP